MPGPAKPPDLPKFGSSPDERPPVAEAPPRPPEPPTAPLPDPIRDAPATYRVVERGPVRLISISGTIDERFPAATLRGFLVGPVLLDLRDVGLVTSYGLRAWLDMLRGVPTDGVRVVAASPAIVREMAMVRPFLGEAKILSVIAAMRCRLGHEFGVHLDAMVHRAHFEQADQLHTACPSCGETAELDESPATFFSLLGHLETSLHEDLAWAMEQDPEAPDLSSVVKRVEGSSTHLTLHGPLPPPRRFLDAVSALRGDAVMNLVASVEPGPGWIQEVVAGWRASVHASTTLTIRGVPLPLAEALAAEGPPRTTLSSVRLPDAAPGVVVDLTRGSFTGPFRERLKRLRTLRPSRWRPATAARFRVGLWLAIALSCIGLTTWLLLSQISSPPSEPLASVPRRAGDHIVVRVVARASSTDQAIALARLSAWQQLKVETASALAASPTLDAADATSVFSENVADVLPLERTETEAATRSGQVHVMARFQVSVVAFESMVEAYRKTETLGALAVKRSPPWEPPSLVVASELPSRGVVAGDRLTARAPSVSVFRY
ncbi:MAG: hypothetical protein AAF211_19090, partial [Myxococcota bacterium]